VLVHDELSQLKGRRDHTRADPRRAQGTHRAGTKRSCLTAIRRRDPSGVYGFMPIDQRFELDLRAAAAARCRTFAALIV
jgi:hypothetical protein